MYDSLQPHGLHHAKLLCPPLSPRVCSNWRPLSRWCYLTILFSVITNWINKEGLVTGYGEGNGTPLQYSCLENPMDGRAWKAAVHGVTEGQTRLSDFTFTFHFHALEKEMATHSSVLARRIPGMGSHRVGHDWSDLAVAAAEAWVIKKFGRSMWD